MAKEYNMRDYHDPYYKPGVVDKHPRNIGHLDAIICKAYTMIKGPHIRHYCNEEMVVTRKKKRNDGH